MTEQISTSPEAGDFQGLIRDGERALKYAEGRSLACFVRREAAGAHCERPAVMQV